MQHMLTYDGLTLLPLLQVNMVQNFPEKFVEKTLIALAINLAGS